MDKLKLRLVEPVLIGEVTLDFYNLHFVATTQIIGMSATLSNIADLKTFLKAEVYSNNFRPVSTEFYL